MSAQIIDGTGLAKKLLDELALSIDAYKAKPTLATVLVGDDMASSVYVANKRKKAVLTGIKSLHYQLPESTTQKELLELLDELNHGPVDGILVQLPLPKHIDESTIIEAIDPKKDVDGFHPLNMGYLFRGTPKTVACTPLGVMEIFSSVGFLLSGKNAVVIGRSNIVGKPMAHLMLDQGATVTICHSKTKNLAEITKEADVIVAAVGKPKLINKSHVKKGAFVVDVGINRDINNRLCGDVDFADIIDTAGFVTPVPGGVGPLTIAMLLKNTFKNFVRNHE